MRETVLLCQLLRQACLRNSWKVSRFLARWLLGWTKVRQREPRCPTSDLTSCTPFSFAQNIKWRFNNREKIEKVLDATSKQTMVAEQAKRREKMELLSRAKVNAVRKLEAEERALALEDEEDDGEEEEE